MVVPFRAAIAAQTGDIVNNVTYRAGAGFRQIRAFYTRMQESGGVIFTLRLPALQAGGHRFKSRIAHHYI